jgi:DNA polymerase
MPLDDRRLAMLREMGVPFWQPLARAGAAMPAQQQTPEAPRDATSPPHEAAPAPAEASPLSPPARVAPAAAPATETGRLDWPALREAVATCRACSLCEKRRQTVFGVGHPRAHWMVVGEAPGEQEDLRGEPFVGPAGRLLDQMLAALGLTRAEAAAEGAPPLTPERQVYIANTLKCRPPGNRNPEPAELAKCEPFLVRQIELVQPRVILAMGRFAVQALLRTDEPIGRLRGRVHRYQGVPLIVTYHPAYLLRNLLDKAKAWDDLCLAMDTMEALRRDAAAPAA